MCGIAGIISKDISRINSDLLAKMGNSLAHRGPDGQAVWISGGGNAGFSHRRLAIIDTSASAAQPMHYASRFTIVHNGEIYNYVELRKDLEKLGYSFTTASDTEVILAAYAHYKEKCLAYFDGMFAFAIWDEVDKTLFCARDRFGEKPFFYAENGGFYFASEIKGLTAAQVGKGYENGMILYFLSTGNTIDPADSSRTFYRGINKLAASHWLKYDCRNSSITVKQYWDISKEVFPLSVNNAVERLDELLTLSVMRRLRSDVPLGTSLSGGIDSSSILACISALQEKKPKTFTCSFPGFEKDETLKARNVAEKFKLENFTVAPTAEDFVRDFEKVAYHHDEPIASGSVYAQYRVFELAAKENVTVLLDGQGADEVLAGYDHYRRWRLRSIAPAFTARLLERKGRRKLWDRTLNKDFFDLARKDISIIKPAVAGLNDLLYYDVFNSGLEQLLRYADRNSMAHGREVRLPFLNHDLVSFVFSLPASLKINKGYTKWVLRKLMHDKLPREIVWSNRKTGFEPPQKEWMENKVTQEYISEAKKQLVKYGILDKVVLNQQPSANAAFDSKANDWRWLAISVFIHKKGV